LLKNIGIVWGEAIHFGIWNWITCFDMRNSFLRVLGLHIDHLIMLKLFHLFQLEVFFSTLHILFFHSCWLWVLLYIRLCKFEIEIQFIFCLTLARPPVANSISSCVALVILLFTTFPYEWFCWIQNWNVNLLNFYVLLSVCLSWFSRGTSHVWFGRE